MTAAARGGELELLFRILDEGYEKRAWHGPNLKGSLRGVGVQEAVWRPGPDRHNIRDIVRHVAYWKYANRRRLTGEKRGSFPIEGSNWFAPADSPTEKAWRADLALLEGAMEKMGFKSYRTQAYEDYIVIEAEGGLDTCIDDMLYRWGLIKYSASL